ncbi:hypothetical protein PVAND_001742 [Polypedilum vanderplanki]|uniref:Uncharacterized protein n=1 Tax=Polypedilum vanderplanki TaxID=319348 RepID=A0A9J6BPB7_POLVA|nr:hypothetical protein PVAND_001742 [Polypedilum vanderplanki]
MSDEFFGIFLFTSTIIFIVLIVFVCLKVIQAIYLDCVLTNIHNENSNSQNSNPQVEISSVSINIENNQQITPPPSYDMLTPPPIYQEWFKDDLKRQQEKN